MVPCRLALEIGTYSVMNEDQDRILRECYERNNWGGNAHKQAVNLLGKPSHVVLRRAVQLGLTRVRERWRWTPEEVEVVEKNAHLAVEVIQRKLAKVSPVGFKRTRAAIIRQISHNRFRTNLDGLNHTQLAEALGVATDTLHKWRMEKLIRATRLPSLDDHQGAKEIYLTAPWHYSNVEIRRFIYRFPGMIDLRRVSQLWFIELLRNGEYQAQIDVDTFGLSNEKSKRAVPDV